MSNVQVRKGTDKPRRFTNNPAEKIRVAPYCRVSTDSDDQLESYKTQVAYYTDLVTSNHEWEMAGIYADESITGTQTKKRDDFKRMIDDCMSGKIDMVITKAISRFARNTVDTLTYVRQLKDKGVAVFFEEQNINTLTTEGEFLLTILSSVAQQEVENISSNVKFGLRARMKDGKNVGFRKCLGYDYNTETQVFTINEKEAEIVRYIFERYVKGKGAYTIARELNEKGCKPLRAEKWHWTSIIAIIKNVKYKGDLEMGKTYVTDPISKKRLNNLGEKDSYYVENNHEPIVSDDDFQKAHDILNKRGETIMHKGKRWDKYSRKYPFSSMIYCGFCESVYSRRNLYSGTNYEKRVWSCADAVKKGKKVCPDSISRIDEKDLEQAFVEAFRLMCSDNKDIITEFLQRVETSLNKNSYTKELAKVDKKVSYLKTRLDRLLELLLDNSIVKSEYDQKRKDLLDELETAEHEQNELLSATKNDTQLKKRLSEFKTILEQNETMHEFDPKVFESMIEKIIIGEVGGQGNNNPYKITFVFKTGYTSDADAPPPRKAGRPSKKSSEVEVGTVESEKNNTCSHETGHTVVRLIVYNKDKNYFGGVFMSFQNILSATQAELHKEIVEMDSFLKSLKPLKFKRTVDKKKINYVSSDYGISYAIFPLASEPTQQFGWYYLHDKETKTWYRKTDYFVETLTEIAKTDHKSAARIYNAINECSSCKGNPCSAIPYTYNGKQQSACYGRIVMSLCHDDFNHAKTFFLHLNTLLEQKE